ncbi:VOC family protein [Pelagibacterium limicola]|uniref:VOC family protein n=1 Tax=Pelagibacterium limicola TaxID=2791022 RepID=UPI0018AF60D8
MSVDLFAGIYVRDYSTSLPWYCQLLGEPTYIATETEAVWELAEHRSIFIEQSADHAGHSVVTIFLDDFEQRIAAISARGIEPIDRLTYGNGVRKAIFRDPDGNEIGFGGAPIGAN